MKKFFLVAFVSAATLSTHAFVSRIDPGTGAFVHWNLTNPPPPATVSTNVVNPTTRAVRFFLASDGYSTTNKTNELNALRASMGQWQSVPGTAIKFEDAGLVAPRVDMINASDNTNIIYWEKTSDTVDSGHASIVNILGLAFTSWYADGTMLGADIVLNGKYEAWFTDFNDRTNAGNFVEGTALHEIGHAIGLEHSPVGAATMIYAGSGGVEAQTGLSSDEVAFARTTYPLSNILSTLGTVRGQVTMNGTGVFGAAVFLENTNGNLLAGTVSSNGGTYQFTAVPAGSYNLRVWPLDPAGASDWLIRGSDIANPRFVNAVTSFLPTTNFPVSVAANSTATLNVIVPSGTPAFRITWIREPTANALAWSINPLPTQICPGQSNYTIGVLSADLPTSGATLSITGDGLTLGAVSYGSPFAGLNGISVPISVASNATPGLRTFIVTQGTNRAYANGHLEVLPLVADYNFDGLADTFQRQYFPLFTATNAAPTADPDGDKFDNASEYIAGTNPTNSASLLKIQSTTQNVSGTTVRWQSVIGKRYQLMSRTNLGLTNPAWTNVGGPVTAATTLTSVLDAGATTGNRFYRVQVLP